MFFLFDGPIRFVLGIVALIILVWILIRFRENRNPQKSSLDILKERLDKGEITQNEYEEARKKQVRNKRD